MTRRIFLRPDAAEDLRRAVAWYEEEREGLGGELLADLDAAMARIAEAPETFPAVMPPTRRALLTRFPYAVYFRPLGEHLQVLAVFHARRAPAALRSKLR